MKRLGTVWVALLALALMVSGCGGNAGSTSPSPSANAGYPGWEKIEKAGKLVVGLDDTFAPMGFRDEAGELVGFDIDMAKEVAAVLGVEAEFVPIDWKSKELELSSGRVDCLWNGMSATPERMESMSLTHKYLNNKLIIMAYNKDVTVTTVEDLKNYTIGTQAKSAALEVMQAHEQQDLYMSNVKEYDTYDLALLDMEAGRVDCIVIDQVLGDYKNTQLGGKLTTCAFNFGDDLYAIGCRKEDTGVSAKLNGAIQTLINNGKAKEISEKWFGQNIVIFEGYDEN